MKSLLWQHGLLQRNGQGKPAQTKQTRAKSVAVPVLLLFLKKKQPVNEFTPRHTFHDGPPQ
jgi:hypothetical protein